jgi:hypothetical protein
MGAGGLSANCSMRIHRGRNAVDQVEYHNHEFTSTALDELGSLALLGTLPNGTHAVIISRLHACLNNQHELDTTGS